MSNITSMKLKPSQHPELAGQNEIHTYWTVIHTKLDGTQRILADNVHNVFPSACIDKIHKMAFIDTSAAEVGFNFIALTADTTQTINAAQTTLTGEISTNGLGRAAAGTKTHTNGTNTSLVEHTFTLSGSQSDITRAALFNAASTGVMGPFAAFSNGATGAMVSGETVKVSITITTS
jgi:DNA uptake protein ComE-like DNA-binding protein